MKRTSAVLLLLLLLIAPATLQAQFTYTTNANGTTVTITGYTGAGGALVIPTNISGLVVNSIGEEAFDDLTNLTSALIPNTVTNIGDYAFKDCYSLTNVVIGDSVTSIGANAFVYCPLPTINIPNSVTSIGSFAFKGCADLTNAPIPNSVTNIGDAIFYNCTNLAAITVEAGSPAYSSVSGVLFSKNLAILIQYPGGLAGTYTIPENVTNISLDAFSFCLNLTSVTIPATVNTISDEAFYYCPSLTNVCFQGTASTNFDPEAFYETSLTNVFYVSGTSGWGQTYANVPTNSVGGFLAATPCTECGGGSSNAFGGVGSVEVNITPSEVTTAGAQWQVDGGASQTSGATVTNLAAGSHTISFTPVFGWETPTYQIVTIISNGITTADGVYTMAPPGALEVAILPAAAVADGAQWQVDSGTNEDSGVTLTNLSEGTHTVSFTSIPGWNTPPNQTVTVTSGVTAKASGIYTQTNTSLVLLTNGYGSIVLKTGTIDKVTAVPAAKNVFAGWVGGTNQPFTLLSSLATYAFTNEPNLVLEANFVTNIYFAAEGTYRGLFAPINVARQQTNSGSFLFNVTSTGSVSGSLDLGGVTEPFSGTFNIGGTANITAKATHTEPSFNLSLQLDFADQSVSGTLSNSAWTAEVTGFRDVFSASDKATAFAGQYTWAIPGVDDPTVGPFGYSYGSVKVSSSGAVTLAGSLADGTVISQSTMISQAGYWPLYVNLYGGKGSLWGWNYFNSNTITAAPSLSWINAANSSKTAVYLSGFTNQNAAVEGSLYVPGISLPANLATTLQELNQSPITNKLTLKTNQATGLITGSFVNPANSKQTIKVNGVVLQGQTNAAGYFLGTDQSGVFTLTPP